MEISKTPFSSANLNLHKEFSKADNNFDSKDLSDKLNEYINRQDDIINEKANFRNINRNDLDFGDIGSTKDLNFECDNSNNNSTIIDRFDGVIGKNGKEIHIESPHTNRS